MSKCSVDPVSSEVFPNPGKIAEDGDSQAPYDCNIDEGCVFLEKMQNGMGVSKEYTSFLDFEDTSGPLFDGNDSGKHTLWALTLYLVQNQ